MRERFTSIQIWKEVQFQQPSIERNREEIERMHRDEHLESKYSIWYLYDYLLVFPLSLIECIYPSLIEMIFDVSDRDHFLSLRHNHCTQSLPRLSKFIITPLSHLFLYCNREEFSEKRKEHLNISFMITSNRCSLTKYDRVESRHEIVWPTVVRYIDRFLNRSMRMDEREGYRTFPADQQQFECRMNRIFHRNREEKQLLASSSELRMRKWKTIGWDNKHSTNHWTLDQKIHSEIWEMHPGIITFIWWIDRLNMNLSWICND